MAALSSRPVHHGVRGASGWRLGRSGNGLKVVPLAGELIRPLAAACWARRTKALITQLSGSGSRSRRQNSAGGMIRAEVIRALDGEKVPQPRARPIDPAFDRSHGAVTNRRGLLVGKARCPNEEQRFPLIRRQLGECRAEFIELHPTVLFGMRFQALGDILQRLYESYVKRARPLQELAGPVREAGATQGTPRA
jgi:hypothetical protein